MAAKKTAKKAAKKVAAKKTAAKVAKKTPKVAEVTLDDILNEDTAAVVTFRRKFTEEESDKIHSTAVLNVRESLHKLNTKTTKRPVNLYTPGMLRKVLMPFEHIYAQWAIGAIGFRFPAVVQLIGPESVGKTSFIMHWAGRLMDRGCPVIYIGCEEKNPTERRSLPMLDRDPRRAKLFFNQIYWSSAHQLVEFDEVVRRTVEQARINCDKNPATKGNPIFVFGDTWTTLMSSQQAQGRDDWGLGPAAKGKAQLKDIGAGSNFGHSKHSQGLKRELPEFLKSFNATIVYAMHQNAHISMTPGAPPVPNYKNTTTTGQKGLAAISSYIMVMTPAGTVQTTDKTTTGGHIRFYFAKNSFGPPYRSFYTTLSFDNLVNTPTHYEDPFDYGEKTAEWMAQKGLLGVRLTNKRYTCEVLGCTAVTGSELYKRLLTSPEHLEFLGAALDIEGYDTDKEKARASAMAGVKSLPPPVEESDVFDDGGDEEGSEGEADGGATEEEDA